MDANNTTLPDIDFDTLLGPDADALVRGRISRRRLLEFCAGVAATMGLSSAAGVRMAEAATGAERAPVIWLHGQECTGCTETLLRSYHPTLESLLLDVISLDYHETLCVGAGEQALDYKHAMMAKHKGKYVLVTEGGTPMKDGGIYCKVGGKTHVEHVREVPPGVDVELFTPLPRDTALAALISESRDDQVNGGERQPDAGNAARFATFFADDAPTILYFGKLIENKGVQVLFEAMEGLDARAVIVGFGDYRETLEARAPKGTLFTGALEHRHLAHLLPLVDVAVVPSIFPEAFGMVAAEAAAAGVPPVVADHSGLAEVAAGIAQEYPEQLRGLVSFPNGDADALRERLRTLLELPAAERRALGLDARAAVERNWGWPRVAERLLEPFVPG